MTQPLDPGRCAIAPATDPDDRSRPGQHVEAYLASRSNYYRGDLGLAAWPAGVSRSCAKSRIANLIAGFYSARTLEAVAKAIGRTASEMYALPQGSK